MNDFVWLGIALLVLLLGALLGAAGLRFAATHTRLQIAMSFVGGFLAGTAGFHLLPHSLEGGASAHSVGAAFVAGLLLVYLVLRFTGPDSGEGAGHGHHHAPASEGEGHAVGRGGRQVAAIVGLGVHAVFDGMIVAAAFLSERDDPLPGLTAIVAVLLHKPLDTFAAAALVGRRPGSKLGIRPAVLVLALITPIVALALVALGGQSGLDIGVWGPLGMAFGAGVLVCVAMSDVLPEVKFHGHDRVALAVALALGVAASWAVGFFEPGGHDHHSHDHDHHHGHNTPAIHDSLTLLQSTQLSNK